MKVIEYRNYVKQFLSQFVTVHQKYRISNESELHFIDSEFIIQEISESSDDEIMVFYDVFKQMEANEEVVHIYLEYIAELYIKTNKN